MNAHSPIAPALTPLAVTNIEVLIALDCGDDDFPSASALAAHLGRDKSNLHKTLKVLAEAGLVRDVTDRNVPGLTQAGLDAVGAWDRANSPAPAADGIDYIPFGQIDGWALNPRTQFDPASIEDMAKSIADKGILQPLTVRRKQVPSGAIWYEVIIGERRRRGARLAVERGWVDRNFAVPCQVKDYSDDEALDVAGVENLQRHDLHWMDEAKFYLRLAERGRSGAEIARLAGESVSKRKVQDYCKIARELAPKDVERCYLPDGAEGQLVYTKARDLVGDKKAPVPLDLSPSLALAFGELIDAASVFAQDYREVRQLTAEMNKAPVGGPLGKLQDRKLVTFGFGAQQQLEARIPITDEVRQWLLHVGLDVDGDGFPDTAAALHKLRAAALGELTASSIPAGRYHTAELNPPERAPEPAPHLPREAAGGGPEADAGARPAEEPRVEGASDSTAYRQPDHDLAREAFDGEPEDELPPYLLRLAGGGDGASPASAPAAHTAPPPEPEPLPAMLAIVMVEAAHKIGLEGVERGPETWGAPILADFYKDSRGQQLVMKRFLAFMPYGERQLVNIPKAGRDWLAQQGIASEGGRPNVPLMKLTELQQELVGALPTGLYSTPWLAKPPGEATPETRPADDAAGLEAAGGGDPHPSRGRDEADREAASSSSSADHLNGQQKALLASYGLLGQLDTLVGRLRGGATQAHKAEIDQHRKLIEAVRETAKAHLPEGTV